MPISSMNINKLGVPRDFPGGSEVKRLPTMWETWVRFLGQEDLLEKDMATQLQYSCLENPMDRGARWATVHGVAESDITE